VSTAIVNRDIKSELHQFIRERDLAIKQEEEIIRGEEEAKQKALELLTDLEHDQKKVDELLLGRLFAPRKEQQSPTKPKKPRIRQLQEGPGRPSEGDIAQHKAVALVLADGPQPIRTIRERVFALGAASSSSNPNKVIESTIQKMRRKGLVRRDGGTGFWHLTQKGRETYL
jgi:hypothetical protein